MPRSRRQIADGKAKKQEVALALQVIDSLTGEFDPSELVSDYRRDLQALLEEKLEGAAREAGGGARKKLR